MQKRHVRGHAFRALFGALFVCVVLFSGQVMAQTSTSPNYQMTEAEFGSGSSTESCSTQYCASVSIGDPGKSSSASSTEFGEANYSEPFLQMIVASGDSDMGDLTTEHTGTKTMSVKIRNYQSGGYRLMIIGDAPKYSGHTLYTPGTPTKSRAGTEQFGINVVANTTPSIGANPVNQPTGGEGLDLVTANYKVANSFMYLSGSSIAETAVNTGGADYVVTMIVNISNETPAGQYMGDFAAVIIPYF